mgnify:CR=1 FL=1
MAIQQYTVGPGKLTFSSPSGSFESQVTAARVTVNSKRADDLKVLSGESIPGDSDYDFTLEGSCLQDLKKSGFVDYTWTNMGKTASFTYTPNNSLGATVTGQVVIDPISVGGNVGERATSDFAFPCVGRPKFTGAS